MRPVMSSARGARRGQLNRKASSGNASVIVVFDTNIWLSELGLRSPTAAAVRFFLKQSGARVAIPEVVRLEVEQNLTSRLLEHIEDIRKAHRQLLTAFGKLREVVLPTEEDVRQKVPELFNSLQVERIDVPFSLEAARSSFLKTILKQAPSHQSQQFKDGVLWADCLSLLAEDDVVLVTADKDFYQDQTYAKGLSQSLQRETQALPRTIRVLPAIANLLEALKTPVVIDPDALQAAFIDQFSKSVFGSLERHGFALGERISCAYKVYATEDPGSLFFDFTLELQCVEVRDEGRTDAVLRLKGDGSYVPETKTFLNLRNFGEHLTFQMPDGTKGEMRNAVVYAQGAVIGHKEISSVVRFAL